MRLTLKKLLKIGEILSSIGSAIRNFAVKRHIKKEVETKLPPWPEHEPWHDNFVTREGEHDHV